MLDQAIPLIKALNGCTGLGWSKHRLGQCQRCSLVEASRIGNSEQRWCERIGYDGLLADPSLEIGVERVDPAAACDIGIAAGPDGYRDRERSRKGTSPAKENQSDRRHGWLLKQPAHTRSGQALSFRSSCEERAVDARGGML